MLKKDYLIKQFEEFGLVLSKILHLKHQQKFEAFEKEMDDLLKKYSDLALTKLESYDTSSLEQEVLQKETIDFVQKKIMARMLFEKMLYHAEAGRSEEYKRLKSLCLILYKHIQENTTENEFDLDAHYKLLFLNQPDSFN